MKTRHVWLVPCAGAALGAWLACSNSSPRPPELVGNEGAIDSGGGTELSPPVDSGSTEGSAEASPGDGGDSGDAAVDASRLVPECSPTATWSSIAAVPSLAAAGFARFGAISANERSAAWTDATGAVFVADRASAAGDFGAPVEVPTLAQPLALDRVALDPTGMELIATVAGRKSFASFLRTSQGQPWQAGSAHPFADLAATISESGGAFSEPVLSADGLSLFYLLAIGSNLPVFYESAWVASKKAWSLGTPLAGPDFACASASQLRRPTGAASDRLTLFFYDEVAGHQRAAWRELPTSAFTFFADLPGVPEAAPSGDCLTLYFQATSADAGPSSLFTAR